MSTTFPTIPSVWLVMRFAGNLFKDGMDTGVPQFTFDGPAEAFMSQEDAQNHADILMRKDDALRWVFKSELAPKIETVITFQATNGARRLSR